MIATLRPEPLETTRDPLDGVNGTPTTANPYHYADNDPLNRIDPLGLQPKDSYHSAPAWWEGPPSGWKVNGVIGICLNGTIAVFVLQGCLVGAEGSRGAAYGVLGTVGGGLRVPGVSGTIGTMISDAGRLGDLRGRGSCVSAGGGAGAYGEAIMCTSESGSVHTGFVGVGWGFGLSYLRISPNGSYDWTNSGLTIFGEDSGQWKRGSNFYGNACSVFEVILGQNHCGDAPVRPPEGVQAAPPSRQDGAGVPPWPPVYPN